MYTSCALPLTVVGTHNGCYSQFQCLPTSVSMPMQSISKACAYELMRSLQAAQTSSSKGKIRTVVEDMWFEYTQISAGESIIMLQP